MKQKRKRATGALVASAGLVLATCDGERRYERPRSDDPPPVLLSAQYTPVYAVTDDQFSDVADLEFTPDDRLIVLERTSATVTIIDHDGRIARRWGGLGQGPGEFPYAPSDMAVSRDGSRIAIDHGSRRIDVLQLDDGVPLGYHRLGPLAVSDLAFDKQDQVLAKVMAMTPEAYVEPTPEKIIRSSDGTTLFSTDPLRPFASPQLYAPRLLMAETDRGVVIAQSDRYNIRLLDGETGKVGPSLINRDVPVRVPGPDYRDQMLAAVLGSDAQGNDEPLPLEFLDLVTVAEEFPVIASMFTGPPGGNTLWVQRHLGVDDELAPAVEAMERVGFRLYDLFNTDTGTYLGTVEAPANIRISVGNESWIAGVSKNELDVPTVHVFNVELQKR